DNFAEALIAFDRARREEIPSLDEHEVSLRAISLLHQSEQLNAGTRDAVREILKAASKTAPVTAMQLAIATELRDEDFQSTFFLMERLNRHLLRLCVINTVILLVAVLSVVLLARLHLLSGNPTVLLGVVGVGALGAAV